MLNKKNQSNGIINIGLIIGLAVLCLFLFSIVFVIANTIRMSQWDKSVINDTSEKSKVANDVLLMPDFADALDSVAKTGMRDITYAYDTVWFDSVEELFHALPYETAQACEEALDEFPSFDLMKDNYENIDSLEGGAMKVYEFPDSLLPLKESSVRKDGWENSYKISYYIIVDEDNNSRAKLLCIKAEY